MHLGWTAKQWRDATDAERHEHLGALKNQFLLYVNGLIESGEIEGEIQFSESIYHDVIRHYYQDLGRLSHSGGISHPDDFKQKAFYAFWIRKLKPVSLSGRISGVPDGSGNWINELIALVIALRELDCIFQCNVHDSLTGEFWYDLLYGFRYKSISPHALYLILASLYAEAKSRLLGN